jgi:methanogenic corrinoid protein MtbC1
LDQQVDAMEILTTCREGLSVVGNRYAAGEYFVSEWIMAGVILREAGELLGSKIKSDTTNTAGSAVIGTVKGDVHNIGKDIVVSLLKAANFDVRDRGIDVPAKKFLDAVKESGAKNFPIFKMAKF